MSPRKVSSIHLSYPANLPPLAATLRDGPSPHHTRPTIYQHPSPQQPSIQTTTKTLQYDSVGSPSITSAISPMSLGASVKSTPNKSSNKIGSRKKLSSHLLEGARR